MSTTDLVASLQTLLQTPTVAVAVVVGVAVLIGVSAWALGRSVLTDDEPTEVPISDGGTTKFADAEPERSAADVDSGDDEELEHRITELETEVDSLSSTVKTVRSENEQISESVSDIEENTSRLLNLYQMATRGVNPFAGGSADEPAAGSPVSDEESFDKEDEIEEIETDVAEDGAADRFSSDETAIREEHCVDSVEEVVASEDEPEDAFQRNKQAEQTATPEPSETVEEVEEVDEDSFEAVFETKSPEEPVDNEEVESFGTEEMIDAGSESTAPAASDGGQLIEPPETDEPEQGTETADAEPPELSSETPEPKQSEPDVSEPETTGTAPSVQPASELSVSAGGDLGDGKPYVDTLPEGFSTEVMTVEWLEYLVEEVGIRGTVRALDYYETIGWLTEEAVADLDEYLDAFEDASQADLSVEHHLRSLDYVEELRHARED